MPILFQGLVTKEAYKLALKMNLPFIKFMKWFLAFTLLPISCVIFDLIKNQILTGGTNQGEISVSAFIPVIIFGLVFYTFPWWYVSLLASTYSNNGSIYSKPINGQIDDSGISFGNPDMKVEHQWQAYQHYKQTKSMVLLYTGNRACQIFTRDLFSNDADWHLFLEQIQSKLKKK